MANGCVATHRAFVLLFELVTVRGLGRKGGARMSDLGRTSFFHYLNVYTVLLLNKVAANMKMEFSLYGNGGSRVLLRVTIKLQIFSIHRYLYC